MSSTFYEVLCGRLDKGDQKGHGSLEYWKSRWDRDDLIFHDHNVNKVLLNHSCLLFNEGERKKIFVPLCGKTLDMKWMYDRGHTVVGLDAVKKAALEFCKEHGFEPTIDGAPEMGPGCKVFNIKGNRMRLYVGDIYLFNKYIEGKFDCILDKGGLASVERRDLKKYARLLKDILVSGGKMFVQGFEFESTTFDSEPRHPPPHAMFENEIRSLFEPDCTVDLIERDSWFLSGKDVGLAYYLVVKK